MTLAERKQDCCGCHGCAAICPKRCISMEWDAEGFLYPKVDETQCIKCGLCEKVCPVLHGVQEDPAAVPMALAAINPDAQIRRESSSGGVFTALAREVLARGGLVFGAAWSEDFREVRHIAVEEEAGLSALRGSKYVQSTIGAAYSQVQEALRAGRSVLFSGTPCQVEGLHTFLGKAYENLLLADIICHGVPSPAVWQRYLARCEDKAGARVRAVNFRDKQLGWKQFSLRLQFENGAVQTAAFQKDPFMQAFLDNACLRPSCYACRFKKRSRVSDVTLADFWGIEDACPQMDDDQGTSLVLIHTEKGAQALEALKLRTRPVSLEAALRENSAAIRSVPEHPNREAFLAALDTMPFEEAVRKWAKKPVTLKNRIGSILEKLGLIHVVKKLLGRS